MTARATFDFTGTQALVTGGTSGIGHATATLFRDAGATVTVTGTKAGPGDYDTDLTGMTYRRLVLTDTSSIDELVSATSTLDVLVNNAGANFPGGLNEAEPDGFEASVALNLTAPYRLDRRAAQGTGRFHRPRAAPAWSSCRHCRRCGR